MLFNQQALCVCICQCVCVCACVKRERDRQTDRQRERELNKQIVQKCLYKNQKSVQYRLIEQDETSNEQIFTHSSMAVSLPLVSYIRRKKSVGTIL